MFKHSRPLRSRRGFTLIELMVVVAIIGILASIAMPGFTKMAGKARGTSRTTHLAALTQALVEAWRTGAGRATFTLPPSTNCGTIPNDSTFADVTFTKGLTAAQTACWNQISWGIDGSTKCRYTYTNGIQATPTPNSAYFEITSACDTNDNGLASTVMLHCVPRESQMCDGAASYYTYSGDPAELKLGTVMYGAQGMEAGQ